MNRFRLQITKFCLFVCVTPVLDDVSKTFMSYSGYPHFRFLLSACLLLCFFGGLDDKDVKSTLTTLKCFFRVVLKVNEKVVFCQFVCLSRG